ncbi:hypothetical protein ABIF93_011728 [Bradyrhizobium japonicum]
MLSQSLIQAGFKLYTHHADEPLLHFSIILGYHTPHTLSMVAIASLNSPEIPPLPVPRRRLGPGHIGLGHLRHIHEAHVGSVVPQLQGVPQLGLVGKINLDLRAGPANSDSSLSGFSA